MCAWSAVPVLIRLLSHMPTVSWQSAENVGCLLLQACKPSCDPVHDLHGCVASARKTLRKSSALAAAVCMHASRGLSCQNLILCLLPAQAEFESLRSEIAALKKGAA